MSTYIPSDVKRTESPTRQGTQLLSLKSYV